MTPAQPSDTSPRLPELSASTDPGLALEQVSSLVSRLVEDPDAEAVLIPQLARLSESLPAGPARDAIESSVAAMSRLRGWLSQLQSRQRLTTRMTEVTARLSRVDGLPALAQALADEARLMLDAPLARLDARPPLVTEDTSASSGAYIGAWPRSPLSLLLGLPGQAARTLQPALATDGAAERLRVEDNAGADQLRQEGITAQIAVPLIQSGQCCGVIVVSDRLVRHWTSMDVDALQQLASIAVRAIGRTARSDKARDSLQALSDRQALPTAGRAVAGERPAVSLAADLSALGSPTLEALLQSVATADREAFVQAHAGPLLRAEGSRNSQLGQTLLAYMDHGHNARAAAKVLGVHVNTLHNRLEAASALVPGWDQPGRSLEVQLALRLALPPTPASASAQALAVPPVSGPRS